MRKCLFIFFLILCCSVASFSETNNKTILDISESEKVTKQDIFELFVLKFSDQIINSEYYILDHEIYQEKTEQNLKWRIAIIEYSNNDNYICTSVFLFFSNGHLDFSFSDEEFSSGSKKAKWHLGSLSLEKILENIQIYMTTASKESRIIALSNGSDNYFEYNALK